MGGEHQTSVTFPKAENIYTGYISFPHLGFSGGLLMWPLLQGGVATC